MVDTNYDVTTLQRYEELGTQGRQHVIPYLWDPIGLAFVVSTVAQSGGGGAVNVTNWPATQAVSIAATVNTSDNHTTAGSYISVRLTDGTSFYTASGGGGGNPAASPTGSAVPANAGYTGFNSGGNLVGVSSANPFPVGVVGTVPVSGTFWQTTQPVSWSGQSVSISGGVSVSNIPALGQALMAASLPVTIASNQSALAVSGTFWQTTQPVSIASMPSTPVTGTFWQATQPVSIASMPSTPVTGTFWQATQPISGNVGVTGTVTVSLASTTITGSVATVEAAPTTVNHAKTTVTTAGTRVQLAAGAAKAICIKALSTNTGLIFVGGSTVAAANGFQLSAGDTISPDVSNSNMIYIDSAVNGEGVSWIAIG